jgi:hypothetical protein
MPKKSSALSVLSHLEAWWHVYATLAVTSAVGLALAWINRNQINPDGVAYIQIARHFAHLQIREAVNGYWSPLLSWLLVPFLWLHADPLFAFRFINLVIELGTVGALLLFLNRKHVAGIVEKLAQLFFVVSFGILLAEWGSSVVTPDLLSGAVLLLVVVAVYRYQQRQGTKRAVCLGIALSLLYFAKYINFYIALVLIAAMAVTTLKTQRILRPIITVAVIFFVISGIWIAALALKYHKVALSTSGTYTFSLIGPGHPAQPQTTIGYLPTHYKDDIWSWVDPSYYHMPSWSIIRHPWYYFNHMLSTANLTLNYLFATTPLLLLGLLALFIRKKDAVLDQIGYFLALVSVAIIFAYSLVFVVARYMWLIAIPVIPFGAVLIRRRLISIYALVAALLVIFISTTLSLVPILQNGYKVQLEEGSVKYLSEQSRAYVPAYAKVAAPESQNYQYCFFSTTRCLGTYQLSGDPSKDSITIAKMRQEGLQYYVEFSARRITYLPLAYTGKSSGHRCYNFRDDSHMGCGQLYLSVYKL